MKFVVDKAIPFITGVLEPYSQVVFKDGREIYREDLLDADAIIIRTRTKCNEDLLEGTSVKMIATATIGMDHIDLKYCESKGIKVVNAAGCNAGGVMNYVFSALYGAAARRAIKFTDETVIGIVGVGNVGKKVEKMARHLGFKVLLNDPPRAAVEGPGQFVSLNELLLNSDVVTMHVPLDETTRGMVDAEFFARMKPGAFFINACRGEVVDEDALLDAMPKLGPVIIDTWNNEPNINPFLMEQAEIATPHIAGYSYQGKQNGTAAAVRAIAHAFDIPPLFNFFPATEHEELRAIKLDLTGMSQGQIASVFQYNYPIFTDDFMFRMTPGSFERIRTEYKYRREFYID